MVKGGEKRIDYECARCGVCNVFMGNEPLKGHRMVKITERKTKMDWAVFILADSENEFSVSAKII